MAHTVDLRKKIAPTKSAKEIPPVKRRTVEVPLQAETISEPAVKSNDIKWEAPSFYYNPQKRYLALTVIALFFGAGALLFYHQDALMAIFLILSSLVLILYGNKRPNISEIIVNEAGVSVDSRVYFYKDLKSFWLDYTPNGPKELSLESRKWYLPYVKVSIENKNPIEIRSLMINFVPEREHEKSLIDHIGKKLGL